MKLIDNILKKSSHPAFAWIVFALTICESIFLFIPPEVFMAPPIVADKKRAIPTVVSASLGSLIGGAIAYLIGLYLFDSVGIWLIENFATMDKFEVAKELFRTNGIFILFITAFTPVPYKLVAICAGFLHFPIFLFLAVSAIFRTSRFALVGFLLWKFQNQANKIVKKYFWPLTLGAIIFAGIGISILYFI